MTNHFEEVTEKLEMEINTFKCKGKEVKSIEDRINSLVHNFKNVQLNQQTLMSKIGTFNSVSCPFLKSKVDFNNIDLLEESSQSLKEAPIVPPQENKISGSWNLTHIPQPRNTHRESSIFNGCLSWP